MPKQWGWVDLERPVEFERFRVFAGYAGWSPGQLDTEIEQDGWIVTEPMPDDPFCDGDLWVQVLTRLGGEYEIFSIFFFAMIFAIAMDYTVFLLSSAREHWEEEGDPKAAMVGSLAHSGRVILAAAGVMVAVFFTFALSGPLPPKEMGVILGVAVFLDAFLVRLLLLPVLLRFTGKAAWYLPHWLDRILPDVHFGHGEISKGAKAAGTPPRKSRARKA